MLLMNISPVMGCVLIPVKQSALYLVNVTSSLDRNGLLVVYRFKNVIILNILGLIGHPEYKKSVNAENNAI